MAAQGDSSEAISGMRPNKGRMNASVNIGGIIVRRKLRRLNSGTAVWVGREPDDSARSGVFVIAGVLAGAKVVTGFGAVGRVGCGFCPAGLPETGRLFGTDGRVVEAGAG